ncbi:hypothetical protein ACI2L4_32160 [Streptomyces sparsogenes]|uniref:hypothetical protein n=1 Tax=Streptomyces sparsogenes TaxID=67365 RepID=UPI0038514F22
MHSRRYPSDTTNAEWALMVAAVALALSLATRRCPLRWQIAAVRLLRGLPHARLTRLEARVGVVRCGRPQDLGVVRQPDFGDPAERVVLALGDLVIRVGDLERGSGGDVKGPVLVGV